MIKFINFYGLGRPIYLSKKRIYQQKSSIPLPEITPEH